MSLSFHCFVIAFVIANPPQNPSAPPIYPCGICHKEVAETDQVQKLIFGPVFFGAKNWISIILIFRQFSANLVATSGELLLENLKHHISIWSVLQKYLLSSIKSTCYNLYVLSLVFSLYLFQVSICCSKVSSNLHWIGGESIHLPYSGDVYCHEVNFMMFDISQKDICRGWKLFFIVLFACAES